MGRAGIEAQYIVRAAVYRETNGLPMDFKSTQFISYNLIEVDEIDLYEDAYGLNTEFIDVQEFLGKLNVKPGRNLTDKLIWKVKKVN